MEIRITSVDCPYQSYEEYCRDDDFVRKARKMSTNIFDQIPSKISLLKGLGVRYVHVEGGSIPIDECKEVMYIGREFNRRVKDANKRFSDLAEISRLVKIMSE